MKFGDLVVNLGVNSNPFTKGLASARGALGSFSGGISSALGGLASFGGALTGIVGVGGLVGLGVAVNSSMERIDEMAKSSDKLGITTESFAGLAHAANLAGVDVGGLESSMLKLTKNISAAANGNEGLAKKFADVGLNVNSLMAMKPDQQFYEIADALSRVTNSSDKVRVATELFGREGADLIPMLQDGSSGLAAMQADAEKLGLTFSRLDAAKVEEANDAISRMKSAFGGLVNVVAIELAPAIVSMTNAMTRFIELTLGGAREIKKAWREMFGGGPKPFPIGGQRNILLDEKIIPGGADWTPGDLPGPINGLPFDMPAKTLPGRPAFLSSETPAGLLKGSREAIDRMVGFRNQQGGLDPQRQVATNTRRMATLQERMLTQLTELTKGTPVVVGGFT